MKTMKKQQKSMSKIDSKQFSATKKVWVMIMFTIFTLIILSGNVLALEFDNVKSYDSQTKTITVKNAFNLPLIGSDIATIKLNTPQNYYVPRGYQKVAEFEVNAYKDYTTAFKELEFYDKKKSNTKILRNYDYKYKTTKQVPIYESVCDETLTKNGTIEYSNCVQIDSGKTRTKVVWENFNLSDFKKNETLTIGIFTNVEKGDKVEWIPNFFGIRISEWAVWTESLNTDIVAFYRLNATSGDVIDATGNFTAQNFGASRGQAGIINNSFNFTSSQSDYVDTSTFGNLGLNMSNGFTISYWISTTSSVEQRPFATINADSHPLLILFINAQKTSSQEIGTLSYLLHDASGNAMSADFGAPNQSWRDGGWHNIVITLDQANTNSTFFVDGIEYPPDYNQQGASATYENFEFNFSIGAENNKGTLNKFIDGSLDEIGIWNRLLSTSEIKDLYNNGTGITFKDNFPTPSTITLNAPANDSTFTKPNVAFNTTVTDAEGVGNVTFFLNGIANQTNTSGVNGTYIFTKTLAEGLYNWSIGAVNTNNLISNSSNRILNISFISPAITLNSPANDTNFTVSSIAFNTTVTDDQQVGSVTLFLNGIANQTNTSGVNGTYIFTKTIADGSHNWSIGAVDNDSRVSNSSTRIFSVDASKPNITWRSPNGSVNFGLIGGLQLLEWNVTDINLDSCFYDYSGSNVSVVCNDNETNITLIANNFNLTFYANDTFGNLASIFTSWSYNFLETGVTFNGSTNETEFETFKINLTTDVEVLSINSKLHYNGTTDISDSNCVSGICILTNSIDIPLININTNENKSFFWEINIFNGTDSFNLNTSTRKQNVSRIFLEKCGGSINTKALNFTARDEEDLSIINPFTFGGTFDFWKGSGNIFRSNSIIDSIAELDICLLDKGNMFVDSIIDYDEQSNFSNYTNRFYYLDNQLINESLNNITLYLLKSGSSTSFILKVQDENLLPVKDAIIEVHRYYPGEGIFRIVQIAKTDDRGQSVGFFVTETVDYKFVIKKNGVTLLETGQQKVIPETSPFTLTFNIGFGFGQPWDNQLGIPNLNSTLVFNKTSNIITYIYIDSSETFTIGRLFVTRNSFSNSSATVVVCNKTSVFPSATLTCDIGNSSNSYTASGFITRAGETLDKQISFLIQGISDILGNLGLFYGFFIILISAFMFKFNEIAGIWGMTLSIFFVNMLGWINFGGVFVTAIFAIAIILTWLMEK